MTQQSIAQFRNQTESRQTCVFLSTELHCRYSWDITDKFFPRTKNAICPLWATTLQPFYYLAFYQTDLRRRFNMIKSNQIKTAYTFSREILKISPIKQQLKWCEILQIPPDPIDLKKVHENNKAGFDIIYSELRSFCLEQPEKRKHSFWIVNLLIASGMILKIGFPQNNKLTLSYLRFINYLVFKKNVLIINF